MRGCRRVRPLRWAGTGRVRCHEIGGPVAGRVSAIGGDGSGRYPYSWISFGRECLMAPRTAKSSPCRRPSRHHRSGRALESGAGVLFSYGSYAGDRLNFSTSPQPSGRSRRIVFCQKVPAITVYSFSRASDGFPREHAIQPRGNPVAEHVHAAQQRGFSGRCLASQRGRVGPVIDTQAHISLPASSYGTILLRMLVAATTATSPFVSSDLQLSGQMLVALQALCRILPRSGHMSRA